MVKELGGIDLEVTRSGEMHVHGLLDLKVFGLQVNVHQRTLCGHVDELCIHMTIGNMINGRPQRLHFDSLLRMCQFIHPRSYSRQMTEHSRTMKTCQFVGIDGSPVTADFDLRTSQWPC